MIEPKYRAVLSLIPEGENVSTKNYGTSMEIYFKFQKPTNGQFSAVTLAYNLFLLILI